MPHYEGKIVSISALTFDMSNLDGSGHYPHVIDPEAEITVNGVKVSVIDLRPGDTVQCWGDPATRVEVKR